MGFDPISLIAPGISGLIGGIGRALGGGNTASMSGVHPSKNAPIWQDVGLNTLAYYMTALGNPMFANDPMYESMYGDRLRSTGVNPGMFSQPSRGFGYMESPASAPPAFVPRVVVPRTERTQSPFAGGGFGGGVGGGSAYGGFGGNLGRGGIGPKRVF